MTGIKHYDYCHCDDDFENANYSQKLIKLLSGCQLCLIRTFRKVYNFRQRIINDEYISTEEIWKLHEILKEIKAITISCILTDRHNDEVFKKFNYKS